jgi:formylglycine-generating enzyme required for sulfatase activity
MLGVGYSLPPEPAPPSPQDEVNPPTAAEAPVIEASLTPSEKPITSPPVSLPEPSATDQPIEPPEYEAPLPLTGNGTIGQEAKRKPSAQEGKPISAAAMVFGALAVPILLFYLINGTKKLDAPKAGSEFTDCANCPAMIVVPAGKFMMGSPESEPGRYGNEGPQHKVTIAKPFAVAKYEVTFVEWDACTAARACPQVEDDWGRGQMPVIKVSWDDAKGYVGWLSRYFVPITIIGPACSERPMLLGSRPAEQFTKKSEGGDKWHGSTQRASPK